MAPETLTTLHGLNMKISCYCLTYRTTELLEEAIFSFLQQDYAGEKELVILNDEPEQELVFIHPQVKVYNMKSRCSDIVKKYNHAVSLCTGDVCVPWDDDDICLPHRLSTIAAEGKGGLWFTDSMFTDAVDGELTFTTGPIHNNHAFTIPRFIQFGVYHANDGRRNGYDFIFMSSVRDTYVAENGLAQSMMMPSYIYRKHSVSAPNHSNHIVSDKENHYENYAKELEGFTEGVIVLNPRWTRDWMGMAIAEWQKQPTPKKLHEVDGSFPAPQKEEE